jgi:hypothetical protein
VTDLPEHIDDLARMLVVVPWCPWRQPGGQGRDNFGVMWVYSDEADWLAGGSGYQVPDLTDPATLGCLRAIVSEHVGSPVSIRWVPHLIGGVWYAETPGALQARGPTEAHALIALALQVTP